MKFTAKKFHLVLVALLLTFVASPANARPRIEQLQRQVQAANYWLQGDGAYLWGWPQCQCGTPAPLFPPDGFYGDLDQNPVFAAFLVGDLVNSLSYIHDCFFGTLPPDGTDPEAWPYAN